MKFEQFKTEVEKTFKEKFGKSYCECRIYKCIGKSITIDCHLAENPNECPCSIIGNDMMRTSLNISLPDGWNEVDDLPENLIMEAWENNIKVKPTEKYLYCDYKRASYRKTKGNAEKLITAFGKYVERLYRLIEEEYKAENLLSYDMQLIKAKGYF